MFEKMKYLVQLVSAENEEFVFPSESREFEIEALDAMDAVWVADAHLYNMNVVGYKENYNDNGLVDDKVVFKDADRGLDIVYSIEEVQ